MKKKKKHVISKVLPGSIAEELELVPGDAILRINDREIEDVFDYRYLLNDEYVVITAQKENGEIWELEVEKDYDEELGAEFESGLMDDYRSCSNRCVFCFIDQMPPGMRETLYFKDDDSRLSFLQGNYVTLTNMSEHDINRICEYHLEPINISFQTTNPVLRCEMLHNRFAGEALKKVDTLYEHGILMNGQIVLCKNYNDGAELRRTLTDLVRYASVLQSVSIVPVGITKFRENLPAMEPFTREDAREVLELVQEVQKDMMRQHGIHFVHASDEWYILAGRELPQEEEYDGYLQLENGVGMLRLLGDEVQDTLSGMTGDDREIQATLATGRLAAPFLQRYMEQIHMKFPHVNVNVIPIRNDFFGESITVSGLITGQDLEKQLKDVMIGEKLLLPCNMLRDGEEIFLDDRSVSQLEEALHTTIVVADTEGKDLIHAVLDDPSAIRNRKRRQMYEQTSSSNCGQTERGEIDPV